ncbi:alpha/beta hydrolase [Oscillatoria sp. CS-180]|uniref:alpha/beta fold hydrolase n=1 Tax=Oscillatoria sp. CS-180 TaxID=3021720 RepID=UPI0023308C3E|nr:alpha/beta hydrolase [Oscillatoria sp. CS-180]MDB9526940.1 alpha/beta hydrolase [Oscillatoria sp. CS-180]
MKLHVELKGSGFPILCLHGHPGSGSCMTVFTETLSQRFMTIAPDLRGYGKSSTQKPFAMTDHLEDLVELLDSLKIEQCIILGWSLGGILAMELALRCPQRVEGLILLGTAARPRGSHPPITWQDNALTGIASIVNRVVPGWQWNIDAFGRRSLYRYLIQQHTPAAYHRLADEAFPAFLQTSKFAHDALNRALRQGYDRLPNLSAISVPTLVLCGECDRHITAKSSQETARHLKINTLKTYPSTAHLFPWEIPDEVMTDIQDWLTNHFAKSARCQE